MSVLEPVIRVCCPVDLSSLFFLVTFFLISLTQENLAMDRAFEGEKSDLSPEVEIRAPVVHYALSGPLAFSYRLLRESSMPHSFLISLVPSNENLVVSERDLSLLITSATNSWQMMDFPCHHLLLPGRYALYASAFANHTHNISSTVVFVELRWFQLSSLFLLNNFINLYQDELMVNVSLHTNIICPQQQPHNLTLKVNLVYKQKQGAPAEKIASRELAWSLGTMRSPHNTSILFGCQLLDRPGTYYATLAVSLNPLLPGQFEITVAASTNTATGAQLAGRDYGLVILNDLSDCASRNNGSRSIRVSYKAPDCVANDKIRLYRIDKKRFGGTTLETSTDQTFLMERSIQARPRGVSFNFPCRMLWAQRDQAAGFCWVYTSVTRAGRSTELEATRKCLWMLTVSEKEPAGDVSRKRPLNQEKNENYGISSQWSRWSTWSSCTRTCNPITDVTSAVRIRKRTCLRAVNKVGQWFLFNVCVGLSLEVQQCSVPQCLSDVEESHESPMQEGNAFLWSLYTEINGNNAMNDASQNVIVACTDNNQGEELLLSLKKNGMKKVFWWCGLPLTGTFVLCLVLNILLPARISSLLKMPLQASSDTKAIVKSENGDPVNRHSRYALMTSFHEEDVGVAHMEKVVADVHPRMKDRDPSRSGVAELEMRIIPCLREVETNTEKDEVRTRGKEKQERCTRSYRSPLIRRHNYQEEILNPDLQSSPRSSSISFRAETSDADFVYESGYEYDDFLPEKHEEVETHPAPWAPQRLNLTVFAQDYEDIIQELYDTRSDEPVF